MADPLAIIWMVADCVSNIASTPPLSATSAPYGSMLDDDTYLGAEPGILRYLLIWLKYVR
jgi:hypothetical protein